MKYKELEHKTETEAKQLLEEKRARLSQLRFELASGKVKNVREIRNIKKDIARLNTFLAAAGQRIKNNK